ncbi:MAG TPA: FixH family protein [Thermodesulfovibrionales bacterium]|nr:FixH family protein [Thermodesulfovibrionales bacterium]
MADRKVAKALLILLTIECLIFTIGCSSKAAKTTQRGLFHVQLSAKGQLLKEGRNEVDVYVTDNRGNGVEDAKIEITPWMPEHGHGTMWPPMVTEKGKGFYRAVIPIIMIGHWELKIKIHKGDIEDNAIFDFPNVMK